MRFSTRCYYFWHLSSGPTDLDVMPGLFFYHWVIFIFRCGNLPYQIIQTWGRNFAEFELLEWLDIKRYVVNAKFDEKFGFLAFTPPQIKFVYFRWVNPIACLLHTLYITRPHASRFNFRGYSEYLPFFLPKHRNIENYAIGINNNGDISIYANFVHMYPRKSISLK